MRFLTLCLLITSACSYGKSVSHLPDRGGFVCVRNNYTESYWIVAEDGMGRAWATTRVNPGERKSFRWPFIHGFGRLRAGVYYSPEFKPWEYDYWAWTVGNSAPIVARDWDDC